MMNIEKINERIQFNWQIVLIVTIYKPNKTLQLLERIAWGMTLYRISYNRPLWYSVKRL